MCGFLDAGHKKATASATTTHTWDITKDVPEIIGDADSAYITGPDGLPLQQITANGTVRYYHHDRLGSTRAITNNTADVVATYTYDPYGNPTHTTGTITNPFGYAGQYTDTHTGHQYLRARYYDPATQNFLTRDPLTTTTRAPYNYTHNNPLNNTDPTGLDPDDCRPGASGGGGGRWSCISGCVIGALCERGLRFCRPYYDVPFGSYLFTACMALFCGRDTLECIRGCF